MQADAELRLAGRMARRVRPRSSLPIPACSPRPRSSPPAGSRTARRRWPISASPGPARIIISVSWLALRRNSGIPSMVCRVHQLRPGRAGPWDQVRRRRPSGSPSQNLRRLGPEGRPAEGQVHGVQHLMAKQDLPRPQSTAMGDRRHGPGDIKPLPRVGCLARLDVMGRRQRERHAVRCGILNRREHLQIGRLARLALGRLRQADPHPLVQVHARPGRMQVHDLRAGGTGHRHIIPAAPTFHE